MADDFEIPMPVYRVPRRRPGIDPATRRLLMIAGGLGGALLLIVGIARLTGHHPGGVPVIEAASGPVRVRPANPGGMSVAGQEDEVLSDQAGTATDKLAPAAETPSLQALHAQEQADTARAAPAASQTASAKAAPGESAAHESAAHEAAPQEATAAGGTAVGGTGAGATAPVAAAETPAAAAKVPPASAVAASPARHAATTPAGGHGAEVQLGALGSEGAAQQEWTRLSHRLPGLLDGRTPAITRIDHDGRTLWRLRTGGFGSLADATAFCARVRAKGQVCSIAAL